MKTSVMCQVLLLAALVSEVSFSRSGASGSPADDGGDKMPGARDCGVPRGAAAMVVLPWSSSSEFPENAGSTFWSTCDRAWPDGRTLTTDGTELLRQGYWPLVSPGKAADHAENAAFWSTVGKYLNRGAFRLSAHRMFAAGGPASTTMRPAFVERAKTRFAKRMLRLALSPEFYGELTLRHGATASAVHVYLRAEYGERATTITVKTQISL